MSQIIFDNELFFEKYKELRYNEYNYNNLVEQPAIEKLLPQLKGKRVLDLGCGYGQNCADFIKMGAADVVGIDISEKMLNIAKQDNSNKFVRYILMDISNIRNLNQKFDIVYSSLAFHYVKDFNKLIYDISNLLNQNGTLLFSQEHPYTTAPKSGPNWTKDEKGNKVHYNLSDYMHSGKRHVKWFVENIEKYHRPISEIINTIISKGFIINNVVEPVPDEYALNKRPDFIDEFDKTTCIIIKYTKV